MPLRACGIMMMLPLCDSLKQTWKYLAIPITYVSIISYSMYLLHYTLIREPITSYFMPVSAGSAIVVYGLYWVLTIALSAILYNLLEKPITHLRDKKYTITI
jgi:peptidoglycan/LPS O-acetylase OafA/YrhL